MPQMLIQLKCSILVADSSYSLAATTVLSKYERVPTPVIPAYANQRKTSQTCLHKEIDHDTLTTYTIPHWPPAILIDQCLHVICS